MPRPRSLRALSVGVPAGLVAVGLLAAGCQQGGDDAAAKGATTVEVSLTNDGCRPSPAKIKAGPVTFEVKNANASKVSEAELLQHGVIIGEKENLTPGLSGTFSLKLKAGKYQMYCPNAKTEHWNLQVTGSAADASQDPAVRKALAAATTGYHDYVVAEVDKLVPAAKKFTDAVRAGDVAKAKQLYSPARYHYEEVEPVAESFGNLDPDVDARANDVTDPSKWTGFHRIEKALWQDGSTKGMKPVADKLDADIAKLQKLVASAKYQPAQLANGATELLNEVASSKITGEEDRYSHTDLNDFEANVTGGRKAFELLEPALAKTHPKLAKQVSAAYRQVTDALKAHRGSYAGTHYVDYSTVTQAQRRTLTQKVDALAEPLSQVAAKVTG
ncbi:iron uptake system protein EfeO [Actinocatenispora thailandica]|uniref:Iron uptake system protein EfeO n=1 Tax=Actinocatenispora thailandica TaxID=227318 RepID=A0A7R7I0L4_9ACTN|nr:iron uptake system protein EfeO [Actinocatenispora thailandica]BCJ38736.1 iron uptake system protein EfeO [Actinocatenispora thailandica]